MEWSKTTISKTDFEKKQREYMEAAINMAKKAEKKPGEDIQEQRLSKEEIVDKIVEKTDDLTDMLDEIKENAEKTAEKEAEEAEIAETDNTSEECPEEKNIQFGVFDAEELVNAGENGIVLCCPGNTIFLKCCKSLCRISIRSATGYKCKHCTNEKHANKNRR